MNFDDVHVRAVPARIDIPRGVAMDYGLTPDTRPRRPVGWLTRLRWRWYDRHYRDHDA